MLLCLPYHTDLPVDYSALAKAIMKVGTNPNHTLAVISLRSQDEGAFFFATSLADYFGRHVKHVIEDQPESALATSNRFYTAAARVFKQFKPGPGEAEHAPMMYMDPTYHPQSPRWLDAIQADYFRCGAPKVFGNFTHEDIPKPEGPLILSREYLDTSTLAQFIPHGIHWRNYLSWELLRNSVKAAGIGSHASAVLAPHFDI